MQYLEINHFYSNYNIFIIKTNLTDLIISIFINIVKNYLLYFNNKYQFYQILFKLQNYIRLKKLLNYYNLLILIKSLKSLFLIKLI